MTESEQVEAISANMERTRQDLGLAPPRAEHPSPVVVMVARNDTIADLVRQCAEGKLPFSGPDSLYSKVREMGFNGNGLYEAVIAERGAA